MLDLVEISLNQYCIQYRRLDETLTLRNLGLNMVAACHEILLDLWWNPTTEDQAVDRAHRIAQTRPVTEKSQSGGSATRLTVEDLKYLFMF
ncbi:SWI/SNF-related matrix-associated actin-dependent regulator of chromatin subfamily A member 3 [Populus alba x Populus x berolinensis]|uniref:SWI/SNF-related matrix-associated actin-dependent regulator of chromatin subfamily A member 3 n=1 Tax=Populus alba x Populus x berolinensis TaxID=444605 RepID=A0AAD6PXK0_9ROSI|nr:SWI/SNF-related matrix-associated actin-dependent regulator of chromatin subfamily A member 3 [Populus alba x Populus x berolinensis]